MEYSDQSLQYSCGDLRGRKSRRPSLLSTCLFGYILLRTAFSQTEREPRTIAYSLQVKIHFWNCLVLEMVGISFWNNPQIWEREKKKTQENGNTFQTIVYFVRKVLSVLQYCGNYMCRGKWRWKKNPTLSLWPICYLNQL